MRHLFSRGTWLIWTLIASTGCGESKPAREEPSAPLQAPLRAPLPSEASVRAPAASAPEQSAAPTPQPLYTRGDCELSEARVFGETSDRRPTVAARFGAEGGVLAYTRDQAHVVVVALDANGRPVGESRDVELPGARGLGPILTVGDRYVLTSQAVCGAHMRKCVHLRTLERDGSAPAEPLSSPTGEWMRESHFSVSDGAILLFRSHMYRDPELDRFQLAGDGSISHESMLDLGFGDREFDPEMRAVELAAEGERWAAWIEATESLTERTHRRIYREGDRFIRARRPLARGEIAEMAFEGERLRVLFRPKSGRPARVMYYDEEGDAEPVRPLADDEAIPGNRTLAGHGFEDGQRYFTRLDRAGREAGDRLAIEDPFSGVNGLGGRFLLYTLAEGDPPRALSGRVIRCEAE